MGKSYSEALRMPIFDVNTCIVEIGSERGDGSTMWFADFTARKGIPFYTVDIDPTKREYINHFPFMEGSRVHIVTQEGAEFFENFEGPPIACLYLDAQDWAHQNINSIILNFETEFYNELKIPFSNAASTTSHLKQLMAGYKYLADRAVVIFDDTYRDTNLDYYYGKGGAGVYYLLAHDWEIEKVTKDAVVMKRGFK